MGDTFPNLSKSGASLPENPIFEDTQANAIYQDFVHAKDNILLVLSCMLFLVDLLLFLLGQYRFIGVFNLFIFFLVGMLPFAVCLFYL